MNFLRICFLPIIFGLIFWFYEIVKRNRMIEIEIEKSANSKNLELEVQRRRTYEGFMGMLVHEIKTPLSIIQIASISLGRRFTSSSNEAQRISNIDKSVNDINDILYKCVQVSDIENNSVFVDKSQIEVDDLINELSLQFKSEQIKWDNQPNLQVFTDYVLLRTILNNLLSNALKYSKKDTPILFFCHGFSGDDRHLVRFSVTNEMGPAGMPDSNKVFERYYRGSNTSSLPGTGLGLWLSQSIAHTIGSHIEIEIIENRISFSIEVAAAV
jgi:K+-sensing histidine kinase KdpD